jgi:hypothetical protein
LPGNLRLKLSDFGPCIVLQRMYPNAMLDGEITITFEELSDLLTKAEANVVKRKEGWVDNHGATPWPRGITLDEVILRRKEAETAEREESRDGGHTAER